MVPVRRDVHPMLPAERVCDWHGGSRHLSHFFNALSLFFPAGERFFIDSVRHYRERITDAELKKAVTGFIGQEAMHTREHIEYNKLMTDAGLPAAPLDRFVWKTLAFGRRILPASWQLGVTIALEHFTAMLAGRLLDTPQISAGSVPEYTQLWTWHAIEETEHKAVAYDVWKTVMKPGLGSYLIRVATMTLVTVMFWGLVIPFHIVLVLADPKARWNVFGFAKVAWFLWGSPGFLRKNLGEWLDYFRPGFHPWDHDNREQLARVDDLIRQINGPASVA